MEIFIDSKIHITNPTPEILEYVKSNLVLDNPEYEKKKRMGFWMGNTPQKLKLFERIGNTITVPYGCLSDIICRTDTKITPRFADAVEVDYNCNIPLYDYQEKAVTVMYCRNYGILQAPAGCGKTQMGIALMSKFKRRALWITHTKDLLRQSYNRAKQYMDESLLGTITEGSIDIGGAITFATIQTLCNINLTEYKDFWDVIIVDECHRAAGTPTALTMFYEVLSQLSARHKYGLSATVHRSDGMIKSTFALLGNIRYTVPDEAVADRVMKVGICRRDTDVVISEYMLNDDGTLNYTSMITQLTNNFDRNLLIATDINKCFSFDGKHHCLVLSERVDHLAHLMEMLPDDVRPYCRLIHGKMTTKKGKAYREQSLDDMCNGNATILFATYSLAKEGLDIPCLDRLFMASPVKDYAVVTQSIGRIARVCDGKDSPVCYDYVDNIGYLQKAYRKRWSSYKKIGCYEVEEC